MVFTTKGIRGCVARRTLPNSFLNVPNYNIDENAIGVPTNVVNAFTVGFVNGFTGSRLNAFTVNAVT